VFSCGHGLVVGLQGGFNLPLFRIRNAARDCLSPGSDQPAMTPVILALATIRESYEVLGLIGIVASLAGIWMESKRNLLNSDAEEAVKDGVMTEAAARRRISVIAWSTRLLTLTGVFCLSFAGWKLFR
jgi:hypothetical protein